MIPFIVLVSLFISSIQAQDLNVDSLINQNEIGIIEQSTFRLIKSWQSISYKSKKLNCQFYPSCSNYYALATNQFGILGGSIRGIDRFVRCNPGAVGYHLQNPNAEFHIDGRLVDKLESRKTISLKKATQSPVLFSAIPGFGRAYYGHRFDGFVSFTYVSGFSYLAYNSFKSNNDFIGVFSSIMALLFWSADIFATNQLALD
ncbi:MAG: membrane protein insertion efficiency factor YidD [Candidatus Marinimicrobia bacterium]|nr:membrane protein insertion efficiency factor YidD [Candidatus Neomarinimicrobiota bacterium]